MKNQGLNRTDVDSIDILGMLSQRKWVIIFCLVIALAGSYIATRFFIVASYGVVSKVLVQKEKLDPANILPSYEQDGIFIKNQAEVIASQPIIENALEILKNDGVYDKDKVFSAGDIEAIQKNITVDVLRSTSVIEMKVEHTDKEIVAPLANAITYSYVQSQYKNKNMIVEKALSAIEEEVKTAEKQLDNAEKVTEEYLIKNGISLLPESEIVLSLRQFSNFDLEVTKVTSELESVNTKLSELTKSIEKANPEDLALPFMVNNALLNDFKSKIRIAEISLMDLLSKYTMDHPEVVSMQMAIKQLKDDFSEERQKIIKAEIESAKVEREQLVSKIKVLAKEKELQDSDIQKVLFNQPKSARLMSAVKAKRSMVNELLQEQGELKMYSQRIKDTPDIMVLEYAQAPDKPMSPNMPINLLLGAFCGLTIGSIIAIMMPVSEKSDSASAKKKDDRFSEKRSSERAKSSNKVTYTLIGEKDKQHTCWSKDIGRSGMKIISEEEFSKNSILEFKIHADKAKPIKGNGVVVWSSPVSEKIMDAGYVAGVKFYDLELDINNKNKA